MLNKWGQRIGGALKLNMQTRTFFVNGDVQHRARNRRSWLAHDEDNCPLYEKVGLVVLMKVVEVGETERQGAWS